MKNSKPDTLTLDFTPPGFPRRSSPSFSNTAKSVKPPAPKRDLFNSNPDDYLQFYDELPEYLQVEYEVKLTPLEEQIYSYDQQMYSDERLKDWQRQASLQQNRLEEQMEKLFGQKSKEDQLEEKKAELENLNSWQRLVWHKDKELTVEIKVLDLELSDIRHRKRHHRRILKRTLDQNRPLSRLNPAAGKRKLQNRIKELERDLDKELFVKDQQCEALDLQIDGLKKQYEQKGEDLEKLYFRQDGFNRAALGDEDKEAYDDAVAEIKSARLKAEQQYSEKLQKLEKQIAGREQELRKYTGKLSTLHNQFIDLGRDFYAKNFGDRPLGSQEISNLADETTMEYITARNAIKEKIKVLNDEIASGQMTVFNWKIQLDELQQNRLLEEKQFNRGLFALQDAYSARASDEKESSRQARADEYQQQCTELENEFTGKLFQKNKELTVLELEAQNLNQQHFADVQKLRENISRQLWQDPTRPEEELHNRPRANVFCEQELDSLKNVFEKELFDKNVALVQAELELEEKLDNKKLAAKKQQALELVSKQVRQLEERYSNEAKSLRQRYASAASPKKTQSKEELHKRAVLEESSRRLYSLYSCAQEQKYCQQAQGLFSSLSEKKLQRRLDLLQEKITAEESRRDLTLAALQSPQTLLPDAQLLREITAKNQALSLQYQRQKTTQFSSNLKGEKLKHMWDGVKSCRGQFKAGLEKLDEACRDMQKKMNCEEERLETSRVREAFEKDLSAQAGKEKSHSNEQEKGRER